MKNFKLVEIESIDKIDDFKDEYVYDIEVENCHTFFANNILVHNSLYIELAGICKQLGISDDDAAEFITRLWAEGLEPYMNECYAKYAKYWNCDGNLEQLELEKTRAEVELMKAKAKAISDAEEKDQMYKKAIEAMRIYQGVGGEPDEENIF
jgi:hypothetical protein